MKNLLITLSLFLTSLYLTAQAPSIEWQKCFGGTGFEFGYSIQQTTDGGYIVAGYSNSTDTLGDVTGNHGGIDYWVVKLDNLGVIEWQKSLGGTGDDQAYCIQQTSNGGYVVAGYSKSTNGDVTGNHGNADFWLVKLDSLGIIEWQKSLGGSGSEVARFIQQTIDGGYIVTGNTDSNNGNVTGHHGNGDYWVVKLDSMGVLEWQKSLGGSGWDYSRCIKQTIDGSYVVAGLSMSNNGDVTGNHGNGDYWVVKLSSTGSIEWQKSLGGSGDESAHSIIQTSDGGFVVAGSSLSTNGDVTGNIGFRDYWLVKLNSLGVLDWEKSFGGTGDDQAFSIQQTSDFGFIVTGLSNSTDGDVTGNHGYIDYWVVKLDGMGVLEWQKSLGGNGDDFGQSILQTIDGKYVVAGQSISQNGDITFNNGNSDFWVVKLSLTVGVHENTELNEFSVYPNPTSNQITLKANNELIGAFYTIYDNMGKTVISGQIIAPQMIIELGNLSGGIYLFSIGENKQSFKVIKN